MSSSITLRCAALAIAGLLSIACGSNRPTIPDELLHEDSGTGGGNYPEGPYCTNINSCVEKATVANFTFAHGWMNPAADNYDKAKLRPISFSDFYDPAGTKYELLMVNTAAFWCSACQVEHAGSSEKPSLNQHLDALGPHGFAILSLVFQDAQSNPANDDDLQAWAENFEERIPLAADPDYLMGRYAPSQQAPLNLVLDATTMTILSVFLGDVSDSIWPYVEDQLQKRGKL